MTLRQGAPEMGPLSFIYTPYPSKEAAQQLAKEVVQAGYAACVNIFEAMSSVYMSAGHVCVESEVGVLIKTTCMAKDKAIAFVENNHPYTTPAIVAWDATCNLPFAVWMNEQLQHGNA